MSVGPMGIIGSAAATPLSQAKGSDSDKAVQDTAGQARETQAGQNAEKASGVGQTEEDEQTSERDADGTRLWERQSEDTDEPDSKEAKPAEPVKSKDATGQKGNQLDLSG